MHKTQPFGKLKQTLSKKLQDLLAKNQLMNQSLKRLTHHTLGIAISEKSCKIFKISFSAKANDDLFITRYWF